MKKLILLLLVLVIGFPVISITTTSVYASQAQRLQMIRMQQRCKIN